MGVDLEGVTVDEDKDWDGGRQNKTPKKEKSPLKGYSIWWKITPKKSKKDSPFKKSGRETKQNLDWGEDLNTEMEE